MRILFGIMLRKGKSMRIKASMALFMALIMAATPFFGVGAAEWNIRFGHDDSDTSTYHYGLLKFKELVEKRSNGRVSVEVFPSGQLGSSRDMIEGLQMGTLECAFAVTAVMTNFVPEFNILDAPFIFRDYQHAYRVLDGDIGKELNAQWLKKQNCRIMGYMDVGFRNIYSSRPIRRIEDIKGLKIRTMQSKLNMAVFNKLGAIATPMAGNEVFTALQQNTIDAAENAVQYVYHQKLYEVTPYITYTGHFYNFCAIMIAEEYFQSLPKDIQEIVLTSAAECVTYQRDLSRQFNEEATGKLKKLGVEFIDSINRQDLVDAVSPIYEEFASVLPAATIERMRKE